MMRRFFLAGFVGGEGDGERDRYGGRGSSGRGGRLVMSTRNNGV